mgnify:CR=1 FL=1
MSRGRFRPGILLHGGAGRYALNEQRKEKIKNAIRRAAIAGFGLLENSAVEAVVESVRIMEDSGLFNAGLGSALTLNGRVEMDAAVMDGRDLSIGAVANIQGIKNPILVAKKVMEETDHILLTGEGAYKFALMMGFEDVSDRLVTEEKRRKHKEILNMWLRGEVYKRFAKLRKFFREKSDSMLETVGAVALDFEGNLAAAVSTGGIYIKLEGRVGDSPLPGAGFYAKNGCAAAVATGIGEYIARVLLSKHACDLVASGKSAREAASSAINYITSIFGKDTAGIIVIDYRGDIGAEFNTRGMLRAYIGEGMSKPIIAIYKEEEFP